MVSNELEVEDLDDAEEAGRWVKCMLERKLEVKPNTVATVEISIKEVKTRERRI